MILTRIVPRVLIATVKTSSGRTRRRTFVLVHERRSLSVARGDWDRQFSQSEAKVTVKAVAIIKRNHSSLNPRAASRNGELGPTTKCSVQCCILRQSLLRFWYHGFLLLKQIDNIRNSQITVSPRGARKNRSRFLSLRAFHSFLLFSRLLLVPRSFSELSAPHFFGVVIAPSAVWGDRQFCRRPTRADRNF